MRELPLAMLAFVAAAVALWWLVRRAPWLRVAEMAAIAVLAAFAVRPSPWEWARLLYLPAGIGLGVIAYAASILLLGNHPRRALAFLRHSPFVLLSGLSTPSMALHYVMVAGVEELVFRGYVQDVLLGGGLLGIAVSSAAFVLIHVGPERTNGPGDLVDLLVFSLALGVLFQLTSSLMLVFGVHLVRNIAAAHAQRELRFAERRAGTVAAVECGVQQ